MLFAVLVSLAREHPWKKEGSSREAVVHVEHEVVRTVSGKFADSVEDLLYDASGARQ